MVKVLCKGGPYYWIKEPFTDFERRVWLYDLAQEAKESRVYHQKHGNHSLIEKLEPVWQKSIAAAPDTRPTKEERKRWRKEYPNKYFLLPAEVYPWEDHIDGPHPLEVAMANCTHITFYGASPNHPNPAAEKARQQTAGRSDSSTQEEP